MQGAPIGGTGERWVSRGIRSVRSFLFGNLQHNDGASMYHYFNGG